MFHRHSKSALEVVLDGFSFWLIGYFIVEGRFAAANSAPTIHYCPNSPKNRKLCEKKLKIVSKWLMVNEIFFKDFIEDGAWIKIPGLHP